MKIKCLSILVAALLIVVFCSASSAGVWYSTDFENYNLGDINGQEGWSGNSGPIRIAPDINGNGQCVEINCVEWDTPGGPVTSKSVSHITASASGIDNYVEFDVAMDTEVIPPNSHANLAYIKFYSTAGVELTRFYFVGDKYNILLGASDQHLVMANVSDRTWRKIGLWFHLANNTIDVLVDGVQVITAGSLHASGIDIGKIELVEWNQSSKYSKSEIYIDNFSCSAADVPEPGKMILRPTFFPGWQAYNICYPCVFYDSAISRYRMYYSGSGMGYINDSTWDQWTTGQVTSIDEKRWFYPDSYEALLFAHKFMEGDIVDPQTQSQQFDSIFAYMPWVIKDGATYKMWYTGWNGDFEQRPDHTANKINFRIGYATSPDGTTWTKYPSNENAAPVLSIGGAAGQLDAKGVSHPSIVKKNGTYHMWYEGYDGTKWRIFYTTSTNGTSWTTPQLALSPGSAGDYDGKHARYPVVFEKGTGYEMWYQGESSSSPLYHVLRATSANGASWTKVGGQVAINTITAPRIYNPAYTLPPFVGNDPTAELIVHTVIPNADNTYTVYYAKEMFETRSFKFTTTVNLYGKYFHIFKGVVAL